MDDRILLLVKNDPFKDTRVNKITKSLLSNNYRVDLIGVNRGKKSPPKNFLGKARYYPIYVVKGRTLLEKVFEISFFILASVIRSIVLTVFNNYSLIYINSPPELLIIIALIVKALSFNRAKIVVDLHDLGPEFYQSRFSNQGLIYILVKFSEYLLVRFSDSIVVTNQSYKKTILERYNSLNENKIFIVKNYPDISDYNIFKKADPIKKDNNKTILLYLGSINPQDGVIGAIDSVKSIVNDREKREVEFWIVGEGEDLDKAKILVNNLGLENNFKFFGGIWDRLKLAGIIKSADICLEPAPKNILNSKSTFIKIFEYILAEKPIISYNLKETRISAKNASIYIDPNKKDDYAKGIIRLINSRTLVEQLKENAKDLSSNYIWEYGPEKRLMESIRYANKGRSLFAKKLLIRFFDIFISTVSIILATPLFLAISLAIKLDSKGRVIFEQLRVGYRQQKFNIKKFRTMREGASEEEVEIDPNNPNIQIKNDPRVTPVGKILRRFSLDELPQFINVLKGEMSLVGPRPLIEKEVDYFPDKWLKRFEVKPGLTGLAQISGRNDLLVKQAVKLDLRLVNNFTIKKYFEILFKTLIYVIIGRGGD